MAPTWADLGLFHLPGSIFAVSIISFNFCSSSIFPLLYKAIPIIRLGSFFPIFIYDVDPLILSHLCIGTTTMTVMTFIMIITRHINGFLQNDDEECDSKTP